LKTVLRTQHSLTNPRPRQIGEIKCTDHKSDSRPEVRHFRDFIFCSRSAADSSDADTDLRGSAWSTRPCLQCQCPCTTLCPLSGDHRSTSIAAHALVIGTIHTRRRLLRIQTSSPNTARVMYHQHRKPLVHLTGAR
jgi:hypothetical protein